MRSPVRLRRPSWLRGSGSALPSTPLLVRGAPPLGHSPKNQKSPLTAEHSHRPTSGGEAVATTAACWHRLLRNCISTASRDQLLWPVSVTNHVRQHPIGARHAGRQLSVPNHARI